MTEEENWVRQGQTRGVSLVSHQNPEFLNQPRYWIDHAAVALQLDAIPAVLAYKRITSATNTRTMIAAMVPYVRYLNSVCSIHSRNRSAVNVVF